MNWHTAYNSGYALRPSGLAFDTFDFAERRISAERCTQAGTKFVQKNPTSLTDNNRC
jgi:hypothetical protein